MGVGPLHSIDEVTEGNEVMEKRERQDGITTEQAKGRTLRWQPLLPNLRRVNEAARRFGQTSRAADGNRGRWGCRKDLGSAQFLRTSSSIMSLTSGYTNGGDIEQPGRSSCVGMRMIW